MAANLTEHQIRHLLFVPKTVTNPRARKISQRGSERVNYDAIGQNGEVFRVYVRQNLRLPDGFSCGLLYEPDGGAPVTLARYNGADHEHGNPLEGGAPLPMACHIHRATEKYINAGRKAEHFAETTDRYTDIVGALNALLADCNISGLELESDGAQLRLT